MKRGDVVLVALTGDYGKPRPAIVVQEDRLNAGDTVQSVIVCPLTSHGAASDSIRVAIAPDDGNGLTRPSQAMVEKITSVRITRVRDVIGRIDQQTMGDIEQALLLVLGFASKGLSGPP